MKNITLLHQRYKEDLTTIAKASCRPSGGRDCCFATYKTRIRPWICVYFVYVIALFISLEVFNSFLAYEGMNHFTTHLRRFADALVMGLPVLLSRKRWWILALVCMDMLFFEANIMYYRNYGTVLPLTSYMMVGNLDGLGASIGGAWRWKDMLLLGSPILFGIWYMIRGFQLTQELSFRQSAEGRGLVIAVSLALTGVLILPSYFVYPVSSYSHPFGLLKWEPVRGIRQAGWINNFAYQIYSLRGVSDTELAFADQVMQEKSASDRELPSLGVNPGMNLVVVIVESMGSWVTDTEIGGHPVMPWLDGTLRNDSTVMYFPCLLPQTKHGRSSDAQLILNTGLLPVQEGAASSLYGNNDYLSLPRALEAKGYTTMSMVCDDRQYWNQQATSRAYGFQHLYDHLGDRAKEGYSDSNLVRHVLEATDTLSRPFYIQAVTISTHDPVDTEFKSVFRTMDFPDRETKNITILFENVDTCLRDLVEGLKMQGKYENTVIVITGDHESITRNRIDRRPEMEIEDRYVPLIILNSPIGDWGMHPEVAGQIDIFPTLLDITGVGDYVWRGLGQSLVRPRIPGAIGADFCVAGVEMSDKVSESRMRSQWRLSDILIRSNWFGKHNCGQ